MNDVKAIGVEKATRRLSEMGDRARDQRASMQRAGRQAQHAITGIPVDTGRLRAGVMGGPESELTVTPWGYELATTVPYARFVFGGTENMRARPPKLPTGLPEQTADLVREDIAP